MSDDLVERALAAIRIANPYSAVSSEDIDITIRIALEEAAKVAGKMYRRGQIGEDIAAAIRGLIGSDTSS
jgi:hypothetical protein